MNSTEKMEAIAMIYWNKDKYSSYNPLNYRQDIVKFKSKNPGKFIYAIETPLIDGQKIAMRSIVVAEVGKGALEPFIQSNENKGIWSLLEQSNIAKRLGASVKSWQT